MVFVNDIKQMLIKLVFLFLSLNFILAEQDSYINTSKIIPQMNLLHRVVDPLTILPIKRNHIYRRNKLNFHKSKIFSLVTSDTTWNNDFINPINKLRKLDIDVEPGKIEGTIVVFNRYDEFNMQIPAVISIEWYKEKSLERNFSILKNTYFKNELIKENITSSGKSLNIFNQEVAGTEVKLNIDGELTVKGDVNFQDREIISMNQRESSNWDLDIEQTQKFGIDGTIGDRIFVEIDQDSEATFSWDNDLSLEYKGKENDILKNAQGGNISLSLPASQFVSVGSGKNEGLFGIKLAHAIGPLTINTILSREQVKKSQSTFTGGEASGENEIFDYNFLKGVYFFIDEKFKNQYYPLDPNGNHYIDNNYVIDSIIVYKTVSTYDVNVKSNVEAYLDPSIENLDDTYSQKGGLWMKMDDKIDYEVNRKEGWLRLNNVGSDEAVGIAYTIGKIDQSNPDNHIGIDSLLTYTDINSIPDDYCLIEGWELGESCGNEIEGEDYQEFNGEEGFQPPAILKLKLIKDTYLQGILQPTSPTWELMFKNVYSLGSGSIDPSSLEIEVVHDKGAGLIHTHNPESGLSYSNIFGIDREDGNYNYIEGGDGKIDIKQAIIDDVRGELHLPFHLPFAYDEVGRKNGSSWINQFGQVIDSTDAIYWGNNSSDLEDIIANPLNDSDNNCCYNADNDDSGPDMYYRNSSNYTPSKEFTIKTRFSSSSRSSIIKLDGFMIVPNSETVSLNGSILKKGVDYSINYDSGTIDFSNQQATDPTANLVITYEENEIISFDQKLLAGTHLKYDINDYSFLSGGLYYYNQSIVNDKVNVGSEPMRNFIWNIAGKYKQDVDFITQVVNKIPLIETSKPSVFNIEGEYAEVYPNPNPLGQAFIDDFESSKRTTSPNILSRQWKCASIPEENNFDDMYVRSYISWYNPYNDILTKNIWPNQETSSRANNERTKTLWLETYFSDDNNGMINWNGITTTLFDYNQARSKYIDIWINDNEVDNSDFKLHIDIGQISEDQDGDGKFDSEDQAVYSGGVGNKRFDLGEDTGLDGCFDIMETGFGYSDFDNSDKPHCLSGEETFIDLCNSDLETNQISLDRCTELKALNISIDEWDPNGDNFIYEEGSENYRFANGTEGNSVAYPYLDTEDLNKSEPYYSLDLLNDYFSISLDFESLNEYIESESINGWKLLRVPLAHFTKKGRENVEWDYVQNMRLWVESSSGLSNKLKIAKIEIVGNEWEELGSTHIDSIYYSDAFIPDSTFKVEVINTDENTEYVKPLGVTQEVDEYTGLTLREQSLVIAFDDFEGIPDSSMIAIKKTLNQLNSQDNRNSFLAYEKMNMYVFGGDPKNPEALFTGGNTDIELVFRIGKDENYYEISQDIYKEWDDRNEIDINIENLNQLKIPLKDNPGEILNDTGLDGCNNEYEDGFGSCVDSLNFKDWCSQVDSLLNIENLTQDQISNLVPVKPARCIDLFSQMDFNNSTQLVIWDPNWDDFIDYDGDGIWDAGEIGEENNNKFDFEDLDGNGIYTIGEPGEPALNDYDGNGVFSNLAEYDSENELFYFKENISHICGNCSQLRIKGTPAVNNLEYVIVGVANKSGENKKGKILIDELRMTGVKKEKGTAFRLTSSVNFADLFSISSSYTKKDADFHLLQQRLGLGQNEESYSINLSSSPDLFLPSKWGIKVPLSVNYSHTLLSPKLIQGTDILAGSINEADSEIQTIDDKITMSTQFSKSSRSKNWFNKYTLDNIILKFSAINGKKSTSTIELEEYFDYEYFGSYHYKFNKDNYLNIFSWFEGFPFLGKPLSALRVYYSPDEMSTSARLEEYDKINIQRSNPDNPTLTYTLNMTREYDVKYKFTNSIVSRYKRIVNSNYDEYKNNKFDFIKDFQAGLIKSVSETFNNSYSPNYFRWLSPKITYNPTYKWTLVNSNEDISIADISSNSPFSLDFKLKLKDLMKKVYSPQKDNSKVVEYSIGNLYSLVSRFSNGITMSYDNLRINNYDNISALDNQDYWYRLGFSDRPLNSFNYGTNYESSNTIKNTLSLSTTFKITNSYIINGIKHLRSSEYLKNSNQSDQTITFKKTQLPLGMNGDDGFPFVDWSISWSMLNNESGTINDFLRKYFKTINFRNNHSTNKTEQWQGQGDCFDSSGASLSFDSCNNLQTWTYVQDFNPLLGFEFKTLGKDWWNFDFSVIRKLTISNTNSTGTAPTSRTYTNTISFDLKHFRKGGIKIPKILFKEFYFNNDITFDFGIEYSHIYKTINPGNAKKLDDFIEEESLRTFTIEPIIKYNFASWVNGNIHFMYKLTDDKVQGRTELKDIGFFLSFKIRG